jgi:natural product precursor
MKKTNNTKFSPLSDQEMEQIKGGAWKIICEAYTSTQDENYLITHLSKQQVLFGMNVGDPIYTSTMDANNFNHRLKK